jgi:predicted metal-dependent hydrolase
MMSEETVRRLTRDLQGQSGAEPKPWRQALSEEESKLVAFAVAYHYQHHDAPIPGRRLILLIARMALDLDRMQTKVRSSQGRLDELNRPHNVVRRAADIMFRQYRGSAFQEIAKDPFRK